jgi:cobalt/nickel transport system ATP-binding protein
MPDPLLQFTDVSYTYPGTQQPALKHFSLSIPAGQKSVLIGHNGCGKSTFLCLADGLYKPDRGIISWKTKPLTYDSRSLTEWRQRIGLSFQDPEKQLVAGTVAEDISYGLCNQPLSDREIEQRLHQTLVDFALQPLADKPLHHLSLGQKRRVALAGVMALQPELLLLDEPTAYLDSQQTENLLQELDHIHQRGTTIVMATHNLDLAYTWADHVFVLHRGELVLSGETNAVFGNVSFLKQLQLGLPTLLEIWYTIPAELRDRQTPPRTIADLQRYWLDASVNYLAQNQI